MSKKIDPDELSEIILKKVINKVIWSDSMYDPNTGEWNESANDNFKEINDKIWSYLTERTF